MEKVYSSLDYMIQCIVNSKEYQRCLQLKKQMESNEEIIFLVEEVKKLQKEYIRNSYNSTIKDQLDCCTEKLFSIPLYHMYHDNLEIVNGMINMVRDSLNDYFFHLLNSQEKI